MVGAFTPYILANDIKSDFCLPESQLLNMRTLLVVCLFKFYLSLPSIWRNFS